MANSFSYDSNDFAGTSYGLTVVGLDTDSLATPDVNAQSLPQSFGSDVTIGGYGPKTFTIKTHLYAESGATQQTRIDAIKYIVDPKRNGGKKLTLDVFSDRYWYAKLTAPIKEGKRTSTFGAFDFEFTAPDSRAFSTTNRTSPDFSITTNPQTFNTESVAGTAPCSFDPNAPTLCPIWVVKNTSGGTVAAMTFTNNTTGETITLTVDIVNGAWVRLHVGTQKVELSTDSGSSWTAIPVSVTAGGQIPGLNPGVNSITITGFSAATITLAYTARYL